MKLRNHTLAIAIATAIACPGLAVGQDFHSRWYAGAGLGVSNLEPDADDIPQTVDEKQGTGAKLFVGYDMYERFSLEGYYAHLGKAELSDGKEVEYTMYGVNGVVYFWNNMGLESLKKREGFSVFGTIGFGAMDNDVDSGVNYEQENDNQLHYGIGFEYGLKQGFSVRGDYTLYDKDAQFLTIGIAKRFGEIPLPPPVEPIIITQPAPEPEPEPDPIDTDQDGVYDDADRCPNTPLGERVDASGCIFGGVLTGVNFEVASANLTQKARIRLNGVAQELQRYPEVRVEVQAHTDSQGSDSYNLDLSNQRAASVVDYLISRGVDPNQMESKGYGESRPISDNETEEGREQNRRVQFDILDN